MPKKDKIVHTKLLLSSYKLVIKIYYLKITINKIKILTIYNTM